MRSKTLLLLAATSGALFASVAVGTALAAGTVEVFSPGAHTLTGSVEPGEPQFVPLDLPAGTQLSIQFRVDRKADKTSALEPVATLVDPDGGNVAIDPGLVNTKKGFDVKNLLVPTTGRHMLVLESAGGTSGPYTLKIKAKYPKQLKGTLVVTAGGERAIPFPAGKGTKVSYSVKAVKGGAVPAFGKVRRPDGQAFASPGTKSSKTGFAAKNFEQQSSFGTYHVVFDLAPGSESGEQVFNYAIKLAFPKATKAGLAYEDLLVPPVLTAVSPTEFSRENADHEITVDGRFFQPPVQIRLELVGESVNLIGEHVGDGAVTGLLNPFNAGSGFHDVVVRNASGGEARIPGAILIRPATPDLLSVVPAFTTDNLTVQEVTLTGSFIFANTEVAFRRPLPGGGQEVITPSSVRTVSGGISVELGVLRRPLGFYTVELVNPGAGNIPDSFADVTPDAFEVRNAPPDVTATSPRRNVSSPQFTMTVEGLELEAGATARLVRSGETDVVGTNVTVTPAGTQATVDFDVTGGSTGGFTLVWTNPDGQLDSETDAFAVTQDATMSLLDRTLGAHDAALDGDSSHGLLVWVESDQDQNGAGTTWRVMARRFDAFLNQWAGAAIQVSTVIKDPVPKRHVSVAHNPEVDRWLVVWTEHTAVSHLRERQEAGLSPTSGTVYQVYGRVVDQNPTTTGLEIDFIDHTLSAVPSGGQYYDEFEYHNPQVVYASWDKNWYLTFTQQWDNLSVNNPGTATEYVNDDYDVYIWRLNKDNPRLDTTFHVDVHTTQNHEGDCMLAANEDMQRILIVGSCDSRQLPAVNTREIEAKFMDATGALSPGDGGSHNGNVVPISSRGTETLNFTNPRAAYDGTGVYLVVWEKVDESGSGLRTVVGRFVGATSESVSGSEFEIAADDSHDLILPRVAWNPGASRFVVSFTVDDPSGTPVARAQLVDPDTRGADGGVFDLGGPGSGFPVVTPEGQSGVSTAVTVTGYTATGPYRGGTGFLLRLVE